MSHKVTYARLHQAPHIPSLGSMEPVFPPTGKVFNNLEMLVSETGLLVSFRYNNINHRILVPLANVVVMTLAPDLPSKAK